jgi:hypothetical protein
MQPRIAPSVPYRLADHVRACRIDAQVVLLDLRRDKYLGVGGPQLSTLSQFIVDWPGAPAAGEPAASAASRDAWLQTLIGQQMLADAGSPQPPRPQLPQPREALGFEPHPPSETPRWRDLPSLAWAASGAAFWMRRRCLEEIAGRVTRLRADPHAAQGALAADLKPAMASYMRLTPFLFTRHDRCLHDSLTLVRYLAMKGMFPTWVIGIRTRPFAAHSWLQSGNLVLNDVPEHVRTFTPILVV